MNPKNGYRIVKAGVLDFIDDNAMILGAALAFYAALSMAPLVLLLLSMTSLLGPNVQEQLVQQVESTVGPQAGETIDQIVQQGSQRQAAGTISAIIGFLVLVFSATGAFGQMQYSLNTIWEVQPKPGGGVWPWLRKRVLSLGMILTIGFLLLVSMGLSTVINLLFAGTSGYLWEIANAVGSFVVYTMLFALIYKILPDVKISWRDVWMGAVITAVLFEIGKFLIGLHLGRSTVASPYGSAGSFVVILLWIYYAALIFFVGAEITQTYVRFHGRRIEPQEHAEEIPEAKEEKEEECREQAEPVGQR